MRIFLDPEYSTLSERVVITDESIAGQPPQTIQEKDITLLAEKYKIQIINTDDQQSQVVDIVIDDQTGYVANVTDLDPPS